jgi:HK97 family phage major capsid protein
VAALEKVIGVKGFRTLAGLTSNISIPVQTTRNVAYQTEHLRDAATTSNPVFTPVLMTPVKISGNTRIGKELLVQANDDVEAFIIDSLTKEIGYKVEDYMLGKVATGASGSVTYSALGAIDWDDILAFEAAIGGYALEEPAYVMSPAARAALKGITKAGTFPVFLCEDNRVNGYAVNVSGCVGNDNIYFGDWSKLLLGIWGNGLEIMVNPYTYAKEGDVEIVASLCIDAAVIQGDAFVVGSVEASSSSSN